MVNSNKPPRFRTQQPVCSVCNNPKTMAHSCQAECKHFVSKNTCIYENKCHYIHTPCKLCYRSMKRAHDCIAVCKKGQNCEYNIVGGCHYLHPDLNMYCGAYVCFEAQTTSDVGIAIHLVFGLIYSMANRYTAKIMVGKEVKKWCDLDNKTCPELGDELKICYLVPKYCIKNIYVGMDRKAASITFLNYNIKWVSASKEKAIFLASSQIRTN